MTALRAFDAVAQLGSLTRAAEALFLTHGAISHQLKALETELGADLVERAGRGVRLTPQGERFAVHVRAALDRLTVAVQEVRAQANQRRIRVSVLPSFAARWLLPRIGRFIAAHPDVDLEVSASNVLADFQREDVDLALRSGRGQWPGLIAEPLFVETRFAVCSPRLNGGRVPRRPADLARYALLRSEGEPWQPWLRAAGLEWPEPTRGPMFNDSSHMLQAAAEGQGIALARESLLGNDLATGALMRLFDVAVPTQEAVYLVYPPRLASSPRLALFRQWLVGQLADDATLAQCLHASLRAPSPARARSPKVRARKRA
jgi:LysR family glycine cleavage system transcriptional activator